MQKDLDLIQRVLNSKQDLNDPYGASDEKRVSIMDDGESLFRDPKSSIGVGEALDDGDYASLIHQIANGSRATSQTGIVVETLDIPDEERIRKNSSDKKSNIQSRPSTAMTAATKRTLS